MKAASIHALIEVSIHGVINLNEIPDLLKAGLLEDVPHGQRHIGDTQLTARG